MTSSHTLAGLPRPNPCQSFWLREAQTDPLLDHCSGDLPQSVDVVIIGSGICGALVAKGLFERDDPPSVLCLEARQTCSGATGRNAGHCRPDMWRGFGRYSKAFGKDQAVKILEDESRAFAALVSYCIDSHVDCDLWHGRSIDAPIDAEVRAELEEIWEDFQASGGKTEHIQRIMDSKDAARISRIADAKALWVYAGATLNPWKLVAHILRSCLSNGLELQTSTAVAAVVPAGDGTWSVQTSRGVVKAKQVVHATNAYATVLLPELQGIVRPTPHLVHRTIPPASFSDAGRLDASYHVICANHAIHSVNSRTTSDGSIVFGGANPGYPSFREWVASDPVNTLDDSVTTWPEIRKEVVSMSSKQMWPEVEMAPAKEAEIYESCWSGIMGRTPDGMPFIGPVPSKAGQFACVGHGGHGMARMFTCAAALVQMMHGADFTSTGLPEVYRWTKERVDKLKVSDVDMPVH